MKEQVKHLYVLAEFGPEGYRIEKGSAMEVHPSLGRPDFYPLEASLKTDFDTAMYERIDRAGELGLIGCGKGEDWEDRKPRFSGIRKKKGIYVISVGPAHFKETQATNKVAINDRDFYKMLRADGLKDFNDPRAYFAYTFAANAVPVSEEGHVLVFQRAPAPKTELYPCHWQDIGGMVDTNFYFWAYDNPSKAFVEMTNEIMQKEIEDEGGVMPKEMRMNLTGIVDCLSTVDFTYLATIKLPSEEIRERRQRAKDAADHTEDKVLKTSGEVRDFLLGNEPIAPAGLGGMLLYLKAVDVDAFDSVCKDFSQYPLVFEEAESV